ncbi:RDD family protein [Pseudosporangium ferrugineum]|uniref:Putative RDD family membrane protein YckC n=1 Tax=Pseudosporangium ferrugineum TaxID=439699 RepID=A0A2T0SBN9_9ACTN|nr:RDD family protein [Pseudosporangium ferrugineum]PRY30837.1 putative RDD family membrane protein YckC [Pseudosporangium ferrugineum]
MNVSYAGPVSRATAYLIDALLVAVVFACGAAIAGMITSVLGARLDHVADAVMSALFLVLPAILASYCALFWSLAGRTPGMAVLGVRVAPVHPGRLSLPAALLRALVLAYFPIGAVWALVDRRHQAAHDKVARTVVLRSPSGARRFTELSGNAGPPRRTSRPRSADVPRP